MVWLVGYVDPPIRPSTLPRIQGPGSKVWIQVTDQIPGSRDHVSQGHRPWIQVTDQGVIQGKTMKPDPETRYQIPDPGSRVQGVIQIQRPDTRPRIQGVIQGKTMSPRSGDQIQGVIQVTDQDPETKYHLPFTIYQVQGPGSRVQGPGYYPDPDPDPETRNQIPDLGCYPDPDPETGYQLPRTIYPRSRDQLPGTLIQGPGSRVQAKQ
jgi:hypothetical protein